jgi:hypothetical protein
MKVTVTLVPAQEDEEEEYQHSIQIECENYFIYDLIKKWNADAFIIRRAFIISRDTHYICDEYNNIYKKNDKFFVGNRIYVYEMPTKAKHYHFVYHTMEIRDSNDNSELFNSYRFENKDLFNVPRDVIYSTKDYYIFFDCDFDSMQEDVLDADVQGDPNISYRAFYHETYVEIADREMERRRLENLDKIKKMNSMDEKYKNMLFMTTVAKPELSGVADQFRTIDEMIKGPSNHPIIITRRFKKPPLKKQKTEDKPEEGAICVIV